MGRQCAEAVKGQIQERQVRAELERKDRRGESSGYWGPEEKPIRSAKLQQQVRQELVAQMEVNQSRKLDSRDRKLRQERCIVENALDRMVEDHDKVSVRVAKQKEILNKAWNNQVQIKRAQRQVDSIGQ